MTALSICLAHRVRSQLSLHALVLRDEKPRVARFFDLALLRRPVIIDSMKVVTSTRGRTHPRWVAALGALVVLVCARLVGAIENVSFEVARVDGAGWSAEGVSVHLELPSERAGVALHVERLRLEAAKQTLTNVSVRCPDVELSPDTIACDKSQIEGVFGDFGKQALAGRLRYVRSSGDLEGDVSGLRLGTGQVQVAGSLREAGWTAAARFRDVPMDALLKLAGSLDLSLPKLSGSGTFGGSVDANGSGAALARATVDLTVADLTVSNEAGSLATEKLTARLKADATHRRGQWKFDVGLRSAQGQAYAQPIFLDLSAHAIALDARGLWTNRELLLDRIVLDHHGVARGNASARLNLSAEQLVQDLQLHLDTLQFPSAYSAYFQPLLLDTPFKSLTTTGAISGQIDVSNGTPQRVDLRFDRVTLDDGARDFVLRDLDGELHWLDVVVLRANLAADDEDDTDDADPQTARASRLTWSGGALLNLDLGPSALHFSAQARQLRLLEPSRIPILDGALDLESLRIRNAGQPNMAFIIDATIQPISVDKLCRAFGWPEFGGQIAGKISKLRVRQKIATLGTTLEAQVFDGTVRISDLRLEQPFSDWPRFYSNIALENLDLALVTSAFSFGGITGRLSGDIKGLELFNWAPVAFDAHLFTPPGDRSRHRISQRAVENIGSIGGGGAGVTAALSSGVMRFFDDFNYDRLGLSCRLENDVCHMNGVAAAPNGGYYLVKGKGLPRIDVIGGARRVDWPRLVQQLIAVTQSEGPVVN